MHVMKLLIYDRLVKDSNSIDTTNKGFGEAIKAEILVLLSLLPLL